MTDFNELTIIKTRIDLMKAVLEQYCISVQELQSIVSQLENRILKLETYSLSEIDLKWHDEQERKVRL